MKLDFKKTFLIGLGFFGVSIIWMVYNTLVPLILEKYIASATIIGLFMTFDNILAVTVQPIIGAVSDKTKTRIGRRMPYILIGAPVAALFFIYIPIARVFWVLIVAIVMMNLFMALYRSPVIALMPDVTPSPLRSKANGIINFMGGVGAIIATLIGGRLFDMNHELPFSGAAVILVVAVILLYYTVKEPKEIPKEEGEDFTWKLVRISCIAIACGLITFFALNSFGVMSDLFARLFSSAYQGYILVSLIVFTGIVFFFLFRMVEKSAIFIFLAIFFWFFGYNGVETFFTLYGKHTLGLSTGTTTTILSVFIVSFILFSIPSGYFATKFGRKKTIIGGLVGMTVFIAALAFTTNVTFVYIIMFLGGISWAAININSIAMIWDISTEEMLGLYTGLYYFFSMLAQTVSPPIIGIVKDRTGEYQSMFYVVPFFFLAALIMMIFVKKGEAKEMTAVEMLEQIEV